MTDAFERWAPFTKITPEEDGTLRAYAVIHDEALDDQGEVIDYAGGKAAIEDFMKWANVREMHEHSAVGVVESVQHDDLAKETVGILHIVDPLAVAKVQAGVYKGTSWGGSKGSKRAMEKVGGHTAVRLLEPTFKELSLVDRPSRPTAILTLMKRSTEGDAPMADDDDLTKAAGDPAVPDPAVAAPDPAAAPPQPAPVETATPEVPAEAAPAAGDVVVQAHSAIETIINLMAAAPAAGKAKLQSALKGMQDFVTLSVADVAKAAELVDLAKSAAGDMTDAHMIAESLARLIESEGSEDPPDTDGVAQLQKALAIVQAFAMGEAKEVGTPEEPTLAEVVSDAVQGAIWSTPMAPAMVMAYAATMSDLRKRADDLAKIGARNSSTDQANINQIHDLAVAAGADNCDLAKGAAAEGRALGWTTDEVTDILLTKLSDKAPFATPAALDAMKVELLGFLEPMKEQLEKVAKTPMPGGPVRYADDKGLFAQPETRETAVDALTKLADSPTTPAAVREHLRTMAAAEEVKAILRG